jgi:hypothetical protein
LAEVAAAEASLAEDLGAGAEVPFKQNSEKKKGRQ